MLFFSDTFAAAEPHAQEAAARAFNAHDGDPTHKVTLKVVAIGGVA